MKLFKKIKQFSRDIKLIIITTLIMSCFGVYAAGTCIVAATADDVDYNNSTVKNALDELYSLAQTYCPPGYICTPPPGIYPNYSGSGCANIPNDSNGGGGNASMSGLTLMMKNASLGTDENIDFTLPAANFTDNNFSGSTSTNGPSNTTTYYYTYASSYTFNAKIGRYTLTNPSVGKYSNIYSSLVGKYIVDYLGSTNSSGSYSNNITRIYKVTNANQNYIDNSFTGASYSTRAMSSYQGRYYTYADSYTFEPTTGRFSLVNPSVGVYSDVYSTLPGKYLASYSGSTSSTIATYTNISTIYKVKDTTTQTSLHYQSSTVARPITYATSSITQIIGDNGQGVYTREGTENDKYPIYYYRGDLSLSNNLVFGGFCWKIIRTTATGGIRMIYNGVVNGDNSCGASAGSTTERTYSKNHIQMTQGPLDGDNYTYTPGTGTNEFKYNVNNGLVNYMYKTIEDNDTDSNLKRVLDAWYSAYLSSYDNGIEDSVYCNDRTYLMINNEQYYCSYARTQEGNPTTLCSRTIDAFGVNSGNNNSTYKVGFITADEMNLSGKCFNYGSKDYMYDGLSFWTGTPRDYKNRAQVFWSGSDNEIGTTGNLPVTYPNRGVRPVITLKANTSYTGTGTLTDPFIVN